MSQPASDARFAVGVRLFNRRRASERAVVWAWPRYPRVSARGSSHQSKNCFTARVRQARVAVTNRRGKEFDEAAAGALGHDATIAGSASSPPLTNAGGTIL